MKKNTGIKRIILAGGYSLAGLKATFSHEAAFRQELLLSIVLIPIALWLDIELAQKLLLVCVVILVLITELLNSAIEAIVDRIGTEHHELSGRAKDIGSAAVLVSLALTVFVWVAVLLTLL